MITPVYKNVKKIIKKAKKPESWYINLYGFCPYLGCQHGCLYCDGRAEKYYFEGEFDKDIIVRNNMLELLSKELPKLREYGTIGISSGISDAYQPIEKELELTRGALKLIRDIKYPVTLLTKSSMVSRDIDILEEMNTYAHIFIQFTLTTLDDHIRSIFEPGTTKIEDRLETIRLLKSKGMGIGISNMPYLPYITETKDNIFDLMDKFKELDVDFAMPAGLTLRPGRQKEIFMSVIAKRYPDLLEKYEKLYSNNKDSGAPRYYDSNLYKKVGDYMNQIGIAQRLPLKIYRTQFNNYHTIILLLEHMMTLYNYKNIDTSRLKQSYYKYYSWLKDQRSYYARRRNLNFKEIDNKLGILMRTDEFDRILGNPKLSHFLREIILDGADFDYCTLKLK